MVRPEDVRIGDPGRGVLDAVVADVTFQDGGTQVTADVPGLATPFRVTVPGVPLLTRGDPVSLSWESAVVVEDTSR